MPERDHGGPIIRNRRDAVVLGAFAVGACAALTSLVLAVIAWRTGLDLTPAILAGWVLSIMAGVAWFLIDHFWPEAVGEVGYIVDCRNGPSDWAFFWRPGGAGYTSDLSQAGLYTREEYQARVGARCAEMAFVPRYLAESIVRPMVSFEDLHDRGIRRERWRRAEFETESQAETLRAVFG